MLNYKTMIVIEYYNHYDYENASGLFAPQGTCITITVVKSETYKKYN